MDISQVKLFVRRGSLDNTITFSKDLESLQNIENYKIGLFGIIETENGDTLFEIDFKYNDEPFVWHRFMHINSFLGFNTYSERIFKDKYSKKYIDYVQRTISQTD
jgi:hypothetical protein